MKKIFIIITFFLYRPDIGLSQNLNWQNLKKNQKHIFNINTGVEYGLIFGLGYGYQLISRLPIVLNAEYSFPGGEKLFDDFKTKIGGQIRLYRTGNINFSAKLYGLFRRYESDFARLLNFGTDLSATAGYYKSKWFVAGEAGFDKAIVTHFKHTESYKTLYPGVKDGWYEPATGGNFYYGLQTGYSFKKTDIYLKAGKIVTQDFQTRPLIPFSVQLGFYWKITR
ncbi:MAG: hypothetical protein ACT4OJ_02370 [Bacteroidota bacterium]